MSAEKKGGLKLTPSIVEFNLEDQRKNQNTNYEEIKSEDEDDDDQEDADGNDVDAPRAYKTNFVRRGTLLNKQIIESDDNLSFLDSNKKSQDQLSERPKSANGSTGQVAGSGEDTDAVLGYDDDDEQEMFGNFKFRSFKTQKLIEEDYNLLNIEDPEDVGSINTTQIYPEDKVVKEAVEVVAVSKEELIEQQKQQKREKEAKEKRDLAIIQQEKIFIKKKRDQTKVDLLKREVELEDLIRRKQERSKKEFEMK